MSSNLKSKMSPSNVEAKAVEDAEDHEIFDINDFTTASDWERFVCVYAAQIFLRFSCLSFLFTIRFIVQIEELINEWKLNTGGNENFGDGSNLEEVKQFFQMG